MIPLQFEDLSRMQNQYLYIIYSFHTVYKTFSGGVCIFYSFLLHYTCILIIVYRHYIIFLATSPWRIPLFFGWKCFQSYSYLSNNKLRIKKNSPPLQAPLPTSVNHFKLHIWATNSAFSNNDPPDQRSRWNVEKALFLLLRRNSFSLSS